MADDSFDISALAAYLHMLPNQIARLADRGKIPARRVAGQWVFSRPEVTHWLEEKIGLSDDEELAAMEDQLVRHDDVREMDTTFERLVPHEAVAVPLLARTRGKVISAMCDLAASTGMLWDVEKMAQAVAAREALHPTALDIGAALLHPRRPQTSLLGEAIVAVGVTPQGLPFGGGGQLTDVFFLICATSDHEHLRILARVSRLLYDPQWLAQLRAAEDSRRAHQLILDRDQTLGLAGQG